MRDLYYHAGVITDLTARWSSHTRKSRAAAEREARRMARSSQERPVVEYWRRECGVTPGDQDVVLGCDFVETAAK